MRHHKAIIYATTSFAALLAPASAQGAESGTSQVAELAPENDIIVTGSRIARKDYTAESPIVTVGQDLIQSRGPATLEQALNVLPQFTPDAGSTSISSAAGGRAALNLRGLGPVRTLVLLDGRRLQPSDPLGPVDLNSIPSAMIENVEVISGGASAVYGSDAVAGVVNFQLRKKFEGLALDFDQGITDRGDGQSSTISGTIGGNFADGRGNAILSASYMNRKRVDRASREFFKEGGITSVLPSGLIYPVASNLPSQAAIDSVFSGYGLSNTVSRVSSYSVNADGTLFTVSSGVNNFKPDGTPYVVTSNNQAAIPIGEWSPIQQPLERETIFGRINYELTDGIEAYAQFNYAHYQNNQTSYGRNQAITRDVYVPMSNPFLPDDLRTILESRPNPDAPILFYFNTGRFSPAIAEQTYDVSQFLGGFNGDISAIDGSWDVFASFGRSKQQSRFGGFIDRTAYLSLIDAADGGRSICEGGLNPFVLAAPSKECSDYLLRDLHETTLLEQTNLEANFQGRLFALPAGDVRFAAGVAYRKNQYSYEPDEQRVNATVLTVAISNPSAGETSSKEAYAELLVPVLADLPLIRNLELGAAYRFSHYDSVGGVHTYKLGGMWQINRSLEVRGGYQRAIRAPSAGEMFQPQEQGGTTVGRVTAGLGDPCDINSVYRAGSNAANVRKLCLATGVPESVIDLLVFAGTSVQSNVGGNPNLKEETSDTSTLGIVFRPQWQSALFENFSLSVDYYNIKIKDAIGLVTGDVIVQRCFNGAGDSNPTYDANNFYCQLIQRGSGGSFSTIDTPLLNLAGYRTSGIDVQLDWKARIGNNSHIGLNAVASYLDSYEIQTLQGAAFSDYAGTIGNGQISATAISHPRWRTVTNLTLDHGAASIGFTWRWTDKMSNSTNVGVSDRVAPGVKAVSYFDLNARVMVNDNFSLRFGVLNLTDKQPPVWTGESATDASLYDVVGRRFFTGVSLRF